MEFIQQLPKHLAIVMDGNGRWAKARYLPRAAGHKAGVSSVRKVIDACQEKGIHTLSLFAFSSENWRRPAQEVSVLMELFLNTLERETEKLHQNNVRLRVIGDRSALSNELQNRIRAAEGLTALNSGLNLVIAANYGGRWDIAQAARRLAECVVKGDLSASEIDAEKLQAQLEISDLPEPDLLIRTGGEQRISNFMLWQLAYTELYFTPTLWPDFDENSLETALDSFLARQRRFGYTSEQLQTLSST